MKLTDLIPLDITQGTFHICSFSSSTHHIDPICGYMVSHFIVATALFV